MALILVTDDEENIRGFMRQALEMEGHEVLEAENGRKALEILENNATINLVVTDMIMPDMDGLELIRNIQRDMPSMRVVAVSGGGAIEADKYLEFAHRLGALITLEKPVEIDAFLDAIESALSP